MIRLDGLHKYFNKGRQNEIHVINDVSLTLPERGMTAIFGKSGCGKTTLLNVIGGLDRFSSGTLTIEGQDIRTDTDDLRNRYIGYIFQNYNLFKDRTCYENVADALRLCGMTDEEEIEKRVIQALKNVGMEKYAKRTPDTLSGGQQQRIAIARAIVKNPKIILADEPTGNLDELNTVMIMDLLKCIAKDHLVLLVTHEADLVDHYCDTVIELSDGKIAGIRNNGNANGFSAKNKNHIYLGELEKRNISAPAAEIEFYGDLPEEPIRLRLVNHGGKIYAEFQNEKIHILDAAAEVKLKEGVFEQETEAKKQASETVMESLPPAEITHTGKLFSFTSAVKSGYETNFKNRKKGKKVLRACMCLFAAVIVFMTAVFGTSVREIFRVRDSYNHRMFYVYTPDAAVSAKINEAMKNGEAAIDFIRLETGYPLTGTEYMDFRIQSFETFTPSYGDGFTVSTVLLDRSLRGDHALLAGADRNLTEQDLLITRKIADKLLEQSSYGHISEYEDLIGLTSSFVSVNGKSLRIAGILDSDELAVYCDEMMLAKYTQNRNPLSHTRPASDYGITVRPGETVIALKYGENPEMPLPGEKIQIQGREITVNAFLRGYYRSYPEWLEGNGISKKGIDGFITSLMETEYPALAEGTEAYTAKWNELFNQRFAEYWDYYYSELEDFMENLYLFFPDTFDLWLYFEKECTETRYLYTSWEYYGIYQYEALYGKTPTAEELQAVINRFNGLDLLPYYELYETEFYNKGWTPMNSVTYLLSDEDYLMMSKQAGESHPHASAVGVGEVFFGYTAIHSSNPEITEKWLMQNFSDLDTGWDYMEAVMTPDTVFDNIIRDRLQGITGGLIAIVLIMIIMSICMYFIMRSSLMSRIKEVGIYRAIGVSKRNLIFRFLTEAFVLATLTVFLGYLATSGFIFLCMNASPLVAEIFYYPPWVAGVVLAILYVLSLICGTIPIHSLLKKTPSEILAKYDI